MHTCDSVFFDHVITFLSSIIRLDCDYKHVLTSSVTLNLTREGYCESNPTSKASGKDGVTMLLYSLFSSHVCIKVNAAVIECVSASQVRAMMRCARVSSDGSECVFLETLHLTKGLADRISVIDLKSVTKKKDAD